MTIIFIIAIAILLIMIELTWKNLSELSNNQKIIFIAIGTIITFLITLIIFNISKSNIVYESKDMMADVRNAIISIFTALNSVIFIPKVATIYKKIKNGEIQNFKSIIITVVVFVLIIILECNYFKEIQEGILQIYYSKIKG